MNGTACTSLIVMLSVALIGCNRSPQQSSTPQASSAATTAPEKPAEARAYSDQDISDAWIYLLGRLLVLRQQKADLAEGMKWNEIAHRKPGAVDWPTPTWTLRTRKPGLPLTKTAARL